MQETRRIVGYNFIEENGRIYAIFATAGHGRDNSIIAAAILKKWNLNRLRISQIGTTVEVEHLHRSVEHLFTIGRGLIREVPDDYNTLKVNLRNFMALIERSEFHEAQVLECLAQSKLENSSLPNTTRIITYHITFREELSQRDLWDIILESTAEWLLLTPINSSCSYASSLVYEEGTHNLVLTLSSCFQNTSAG